MGTQKEKNRDTNQKNSGTQPAAKKSDNNKNTATEKKENSRRK
ncbi:hypothetical protein [Aequorivita aurantiaca]|nr:hypothetical protein [Aequorivita aurantiaca]